METNPVQNTPSAAPDAQIAAYASVKKKIVPYTLDRRDWCFAGAAVILCLFMTIAGLWGGLQAGFTAAYLLLFCVCTVYLRDPTIKVSVFSVLSAVLAVPLSAVCFVTSGTLVRFFAVILIGILTVLWLTALAGKAILPGELGLFQRFLRTIGCTLSRMPRALRSLTATENAHVRSASKVLLGLLCASPVLCAVIPLLIRSDAAFEGFMQRLFVDAGTTAAQILLAACLFPFLLSFGFATKKETDSMHDRKPYGGMDTAFLSAFLGILSLCYLVFLFTQLAYFFSAFSGILPQGYTFSVVEYARRGFFELCWIAGINLTILYGMLLLSKKNADKPPVILRAFGVFIDVFTLLLIATAIAKMILYIRVYGVTVLRIGTSAFMVFMAVVFLAMLLRFFLPRVRVLPVALITASLVVLVLGLGNVHAFAAKYNFNAYESGKLSTIDTAYLLELGDEGIPYLTALSECQDSEIQEKACGALCLAIERRYDGEYKDVRIASRDVTLQYFEPQKQNASRLSQISIPRRKAYAALDALLKEQPEFLLEHAEERESIAAEYADFWQ